MSRAVAALVALWSVLCLPGESGAQTGCARQDLVTTVNTYLSAQRRGVTSSLPLAAEVKYSENMQDGSIDVGILKTPLKIDFYRSLIDSEACQTFTEVIVTDPSHPYVLGVRLKIAAGRITEVETLVTDK